MGVSLDYERQLIPRAKQLRKDPTPWERKLWYDFLRDYPVRFQRQKAVGRYIVDFYCAKSGLVIELDGGGHFTPEQAAYDVRRTAELSAMRLHLLRFLNTDIDQNFYGVCTQIDQAVKSFTRTAPPASHRTAGG